MSAITLSRPARRRETVLGSAGRDSRTRYFNVFCGSVLLVFAAMWVIPLLWAVDTSLRPEGDVTTHPTSWWTSHWTIGAYRSILNSSDMATWYMNSFIISALSALFTVIVCSMAGFALARTGFRGNKAVTGLLLAGLLVPGQVLILPMFAEFSGMHLLNTYWAIVLPSIPAPVAVFVFMSFFNGLPAELVEAARVDGASWLRVYLQIFMPLCKPAISAVTIFTFVWSWNSLLWPLLVMTSTKLMTIPVGLATVQSAFGIQYARVMASAVLGALPLIVVFLLFQRRIVEGVANTGIK